MTPIIVKNISGGEITVFFRGEAIKMQPNEEFLGQSCQVEVPSEYSNCYVWRNMNEKL
jgi:hypothetical protein